MTVDLKDPYDRALFEAIQTVYKNHRGDAPLYMVNTAEWVEAIKPVIKNMLNDAVTDAIHPEFGWYWQEQD